MLPEEGVIKYQLTHTNRPLDPGLATENLNAWRHILFRLNLIGQDDNRYDGLGFGNISERLNGDCFIISGTQTGHLPQLSSADFAIVDTAEPELNRLCSHGLKSPSSEALTHALIYQRNKKIKAVIHVHCPEIWRHTAALDLPFTQRNIAYGSVEMVLAVKELFNQEQLTTNALFTMLGHKDGVVAFGSDLHSAAILVIQTFAYALAIERKKQNN